MAIWNLGSINIDHVYRLPHLPLPGETLAATGYSQGMGGKGANQSIAAARAGSITHHLGAMGTGHDWLLARLAAAGVQTQAIQRLDTEATGHAVILLDAMAENAIVIHAGANRAINTTRLTAALSAIGLGDLLLLQNETSAQGIAAAVARDRGARVVYSAAPFDAESVQSVLPHVSVLAMNEGEAAQLQAALPGGLPVEGLLITKGVKGAEYRDLRSGAVYHQAAFRVQPVDTTGAGDTFAGYFAAGIDQGLVIAQALRLAAGAAALKVTRPGAGDAIPSRAEVEVFLKDQPI